MQPMLVKSRALMHHRSTPDRTGRTMLVPERFGNRRHAELRTRYRNCNEVPDT